MMVDIGDFPLHPDPREGVLEKDANVRGEIAYRVDFRRLDGCHGGFLTHAPCFVKPFPPAPKRLFAGLRLRWSPRGTRSLKRRPRHNTMRSPRGRDLDAVPIG